MQSNDLDKPSDGNPQRKKPNRQHLSDFNRKPLKEFQFNESRWAALEEVFSFFGTTLIANPLIWPSLPHKEWWSEDYVPLRDLHPSHLGECWIIFAYEKTNPQVQEGDYPVRTDGLVLPCRWRRGSDVGYVHDERLPKSLIRLADSVKKQMAPLAEKQNFIFKADEFYLHLADFPNAKLDNLLEDVCELVDFGSEKGTTGKDNAGDVGSAWGALSTGLYFALQNMAPPSVWPFSSIAYDATDKSVKPVGFLKGKLSVVADFNVNQFVVANVAQVKEAKELRKQLVQETKQRIREDKDLLRKLKKEKEKDSSKIHYVEMEIDNLEKRLEGLREIVPVEVKSSKELLGIIDDIANGYARRRRRRSVVYILELLVVLLTGLCSWQMKWRKEAIAKDHLDKAIALLESREAEPKTDVAIHHLAQAADLSEAQQLFVNLVCKKSWLVPISNDETEIMERVKNDVLPWKHGIHLPENYPLDVSVDLQFTGLDLVSQLKDNKNKELWRVNTHLEYMDHAELSPDGLVILLEGLCYGKNQLVTFNMLTGEQIWRRIIQGNVICGSFSSDGKLFAYVNQSGHLHVVNAEDGSNEYEPLEIGRDIRSVRFSKNDTRIFIKRKNKKLSAYKLHHVFPDVHDYSKSGYRSPVFDGKNNIIYRICDTDSRLEKVDPFTMEVLDFIKFPGYGRDLRLSDDGRFLLFSSFGGSMSAPESHLSNKMLKKIAEGKDVDLDALAENMLAGEDREIYHIYLFDLQTCFQDKKSKIIRVPFLPDSMEFMPGNESCILAGESQQPCTILRWNFAEDSVGPAFKSLEDKNINGFALTAERIAVYDGWSIDILTLDGTKKATIPRDANTYRYVFMTKNGFLIKVNKGYRQLSVYNAKNGKECWHLDGYKSVRENSRWGIPFAVNEENMEIAVAVTDTSIQRFDLKTGEKIGEETSLDWVVSQIQYVRRIDGMALMVGGSDMQRGLSKKGHYALIGCRNMNVLQDHDYVEDEFVSFFGDESNLFVLFDKKLFNIQNYLSVQKNNEAFVYLCEWLKGFMPAVNPPKAEGIWHWLIAELFKTNPGERRMSLNDNNTFATLLPQMQYRMYDDENDKAYLAWPQNIDLIKTIFLQSLEKMAKGELARQNPEFDKDKLSTVWIGLSELQRIEFLKNNPVCQYAIENKEQMLKDKVADYSEQEKFANIRKQIDFILGRNDPPKTAPDSGNTATKAMQALQQEATLDLDKLSEIIKPYLLEQLDLGNEDAFKPIFDILGRFDAKHDLDIPQKTMYLSVMEQISIFEPFLPNGHRQVTDGLEKLASDMERQCSNLHQYRNLLANIQLYLIPLQLIDRQPEKAAKSFEAMRLYGEDDFVLPIMFDLYDMVIKAYGNQEHDIFRQFFEWMGKINLNEELRQVILESFYSLVMDLNRRLGVTSASKRLQESMEGLLKKSGTFIEVAPKSVAASLGWESGDRIFDMDGIAVLRREQLEVVLNYLKRYKANEKITVRINRKGQTVTTQLDIAALIKGIGIAY